MVSASEKWRVFVWQAWITLSRVAIHSVALRHLSAYALHPLHTLHTLHSVGHVHLSEERAVRLDILCG